MTPAAPPPGAPLSEVLAYYQAQAKPKRVYTDAQKQLLAEHRCVECGAPSSERPTKANAEVKWFDLCLDCSKAKNYGKGGFYPRGGAATKNLSGQFKAALGYSTAESGAPSHDGHGDNE